MNQQSDEIAILQRLHEMPEIFHRLAEIGPTDEFQLQHRLRKEFPARLVPPALTLHELRRKARKKFTRADEMWFDRIGLEQATGEVVARHKAVRFDGPVWDLCCGIGGDAIALAEKHDVIAVDTSSASALRCEYNLEVCQIRDHVDIVTGDATQQPIDNTWIHVDPDRRPGNQRRSSGHRSLRIEDGSPDLAALGVLMQRARGGAVKLSPAANFPGKFPDCEIELVSFEGECKEATIWFGELAKPNQWRATLLPEGKSICGHPLDAFSQVGSLRRYLYDPNPAVVRAGMIDMITERLNLERLDLEEEYLTSDLLVDSPFVTPFEVLADLPNNEREIRAEFRKWSFGQVEIKCRRIPTDVNRIRRKLPLDGERSGVLIFARVNGKTRAIVGRRTETDKCST